MYMIGTVDLVSGERAIELDSKGGFRTYADDRIHELVGAMLALSESRAGGAVACVILGIGSADDWLRSPAWPYESHREGGGGSLDQDTEELDPADYDALAPLGGTDDTDQAESYVWPL